jgi:hypothetical protein
MLTVEIKCAALSVPAHGSRDVALIEVDDALGVHFRPLAKIGEPLLVRTVGCAHREKEARLAKDSIMMGDAPLSAAERDRTRRTLLHEHDQRADVAGAKLTSVTHAHAHTAHTAHTALT